VSDLPLRTRVYTLLLILITGAALVFTWRRFELPLDQSHLVTAGILLVMILLAELLDVSFPHSVITFHVSVSAAFCFAAGLTVGPVLGGVVVALAHLLDGIYVRREWIKTTVNAFGLGLSTIVSGAVYLALADPARSPLGSYQNLVAATLAAVAYTLVNSGSLALIVSPVVGMGPYQMWRANFGGLYLETITVATLGSLIPVLVAENQLAVVLLIVPLLLGPHLAFKAIRQAHHETRVAMEGLADALERRDPYTFHHSRRVTAYVRAILDLMPHVPRPTAEAIAAAAHVHDLGKVGAQDGSLKKPGELSALEREEIQAHAAVGADIVSRLEAYKPSVESIRHHHERWDGSGYPDGLAGERIPLGARIIAVADAFDAMTSDRVYRAALSPERALAELRAGAGAQFDQQIVDLFHRAHAAGTLLPGQTAAPTGAAPRPAAPLPPPAPAADPGPLVAAARETELVEVSRGPR
jgi:HD-GYP domain-containing protein (c-di-GMP phosphodiesterase class II)